MPDRKILFPAIRLTSLDQGIDFVKLGPMDGRAEDDFPGNAPEMRSGQAAKEPAGDEALVEKLAEQLHGTMERLDPVGSEWAALSSYEREFYRTRAEDFLRSMQSVDVKSR